MKADKYAEMFMEEYKTQLVTENENDATTNAIIKICWRLAQEIRDIGLSRKANCDSAWLAILKEQNQKWRAIVRRLDKDRLSFLPNPDAFQIVWEAVGEIKDK